MKFEYKSAYFGSHELTELGYVEYLNSEGKKGWELVQVIQRPYRTGENAGFGVANMTFLFKRATHGK